MKPSDQCKMAGLSSLKELAQFTGDSEQTLINISRTRPNRFYIMLAGAVSVKAMLRRQAMGKYTLHSMAITNAQLDQLDAMPDGRRFNGQSGESGTIIDCDAMSDDEREELANIVPDLPEAEYYHFYN